MSTPAEKARAVARETGWSVDEYAADSGWSAVGIGPVGQHRDSDALDRSNFTVIYGDLRERFAESVDVVRFGHWAVGWVEEIAFDAGNAEVSAAVEAWREELDAYPVADESHYSELEYGEFSEYVTHEIRHYGPDDWAPEMLELLISRTVDLLTEDYSRPEDLGPRAIEDATEDAAVAMILEDYEPGADQMALEITS